MSVKHITLVTVAAAILLVFSAVAVSDVVKTREIKEVQKIQLKSKASEIKGLNIQLDKLNSELDNAIKRKNVDQSEVQRLQQEIENYNKKVQELEAQLQAKLQEKSRLAQAAQKVAQTATVTEKAHAAPAPTAPSGSLESIIALAAASHGVSYNMMIHMAQCESTMGQFLRNSEPVIVNGVNYGHAEGVYQFIPSTWTRMSGQAGYAGASVYDTVANVNTAAWAFANGHKGEWECQ